MQRVILATVAGLLAVVATYAALRGFDRLFVPQPNPATVISSTAIAMFSRLSVGVYVGLMVAFGVHLAAGRSATRTLRALSIAVPVVAGAIALQGLVLP
jgi:ABC-type sugar transport system permease subunit